MIVDIIEETTEMNRVTTDFENGGWGEGGSGSGGRRSLLSLVGGPLFLELTEE